MSLHIQTCLLESSRQRNTQNMYENVFLWKKNQETFYLIFKALSERWCFPAEMVAMSDFWCKFMPNENKQSWHNLNIWFGLQWSIWHTIWQRPCMRHFFFLSNSSHTIFLFKLWRKIHLWRKKIVSNMEMLEIW